ncbi:MAG: CPBP family intramembrane metalloprotease, partial [Chloroflexi bacterium]|nr:CPBP family intramembrane metalloprotease [Chloroflexota bacterium]
RDPVASLYILAFAISWLGWVPQALFRRGMFPLDTPLFTLLGGGGPTLAAIIVTLALHEKGGIRRLFAPLAQWRASPGWFVFVGAFWFVVAGIALGLGALGGQKIPPFDPRIGSRLFAVFVGMLLSNVWEEIGWRGFALPRLQERLADWVIVLFMGILWSLWHLPLLWNPSSPMSHLPFYGEILFSLALTVLYTWLYRNTKGSLLFVTIFHALSNTVAFALFEWGVFESSYPFVVAVVSLAALGVILRHGPRRFIASPEASVKS